MGEKGRSEILGYKGSLWYPLSLSWGGVNELNIKGMLRRIYLVLWVIWLTVALELSPFGYIVCENQGMLGRIREGVWRCLLQCWFDEFFCLNPLKEMLFVSFVPYQKGNGRAKWNHLERGEILPSIESCWACSEVRRFHSIKRPGQESEGTASREAEMPGDCKTVKKYKEQIQGWPQRWHYFHVDLVEAL